MRFFSTWRIENAVYPPSIHRRGRRGRRRRYDPGCVCLGQVREIAVGGKALYYYLPISIAESLGYFKDEGLDVQIIDFQAARARCRAVVGGSADVVSGAFEQRRYLRVLRAAGPCAAVRLCGKQQDDAQLQDLDRSEGQEDRRHSPGLELARHRAVRALFGPASSPTKSPSSAWALRLPPLPPCAQARSTRS